VGGKAIEGAFFSNHFSTDDKSPTVQDFVAKYNAKYNVLPDAFAALGYDAAKLLADAIKRAGSTDSQKLREAIAATKDFPGVSGKITINPERDADKSAVILTIKDGAVHYFPDHRTEGQPKGWFMKSLCALGLGLLIAGFAAGD
jgi:branched-chain amino acid transport system substrate-binding protein